MPKSPMSKLVILIVGLFLPSSLAAKSSANIDTDDIKKLIEKAQKKFLLPAVAVVAMDSKDLFSKVISGKIALNQDRKAELNDYFHIGSGAKSVLATIAGKLVDQEKITWDTKFFDLHPSMLSSAHKDYHNLNLEELLSFRGGVLPYTDLKELFALDPKSSQNRGEFIRLVIKNQPDHHRVGGKFEARYSNASYVLATSMLEKASGKTWEELIHTTFSLGTATKAFIGWPHEYGENQPLGHAPYTGDSFYDWIRESLITPPPSDIVLKLKTVEATDLYHLPKAIDPAGNLSFTPLDYARYVQLHLKGLRGETNYLEASTYKKIHFGYEGLSMGVQNFKDGDLRFSTFDGSAGTFYSHAMIAPDSNFAFIILVNARDEQSVEGVHWLSQKILKKFYNLWWMFWM